MNVSNSSDLLLKYFECPNHHFEQSNHFYLYLNRGIEEFYGMVGAVHIIQGTLGKAICGAAGTHHSQLYIYAY